MIFIQPDPAHSLDEDTLERAANETLKHEGALGDITVVLTDDNEIQQLNRDFLGNDAPTDVLSFPASESDPETGNPYLGDIIISIPRAAQQANAAGHELIAEVQLLIVHGTLHLLGYDHAEAAEKNKMWQAQAEVLKRLGLADIKITE
jgi:probable rRNA maturation factor